MNALTIGLSALAFAMRAVEVQLDGLGETHRASSGRCRWTLRGSKLRVSELERSCPMKYLPGYEALSGEAIASARTLLGQERPTPRAAARIGRKLWDRGYRRSDGGQYQQAPVLRALKARQWTHVITPLQRLDGLGDG